MDSDLKPAFKGRPRRQVIGLAGLAVLVVLTGCSSDSDRTSSEPEVVSLPEQVAASPTTAATKAKPAGARCRKRIETAKYEEFIPPTQREGSNAVLPVVFADGSSAELVYPPRLKLAELGVQPATSVGIYKGKSRFVHPRFLMITKSSLAEFRSHGPPVETYEGRPEHRRCRDPCAGGRCRRA